NGEARPLTTNVLLPVRGRKPRWLSAIAGASGGVMFRTGSSTGGPFCAATGLAAATGSTASVPRNCLRFILDPASRVEAFGDSRSQGTEVGHASTHHDRLRADAPA